MNTEKKKKGEEDAAARGLEKALPANQSTKHAEYEKLNNNLVFFQTNAIINHKLRREGSNYFG